MRALIQRTSGAKVTIDDEIVGEIGPGLVVFVCAMRGDSELPPTPIPPKRGIQPRSNPV